jgi:hypothetical protein
MYEVYLGLAKNVSVCGLPSSIFEKLETVTSGLPITSP